MQKIGPWEESTKSCDFIYQFHHKKFTILNADVSGSVEKLRDSAFTHPCFNPSIGSNVALSMFHMDLAPAQSNTSLYGQRLTY